MWAEGCCCRHVAASVEQCSVLGRSVRGKVDGVVCVEGLRGGGPIVWVCGWWWCACSTPGQRSAEITEWVAVASVCTHQDMAGGVGCTWKFCLCCASSSPQ